MDSEMDPSMDPKDFLVWDELVDPGKQYQCPNRGRLMDSSCVARSEEHDGLVVARQGGQWGFIDFQGAAGG